MGPDPRPVAQAKRANVMSPYPVPKRVCPVCGEFLPHACAALVTITRRPFTGRKVVAITDRGSS